MNKEKNKFNRFGRLSLFTKRLSKQNRMKYVREIKALQEAKYSDDQVEKFTENPVVQDVHLSEKALLEDRLTCESNQRCENAILAFSTLKIDSDLQEGEEKKEKKTDARGADEDENREKAKGQRGNKQEEDEEEKDNKEELEQSKGGTNGENKETDEEKEERKECKEKRGIHESISSSKKIRITRGTFHQGDPRIFKDTAGIQCTANAAASIVMSHMKTPALWTPRDVDSVLMVGDEVYRRSVESRPSVNAEAEIGVNTMYLNALELVRDISMNSSNCRIAVGVADLGHLQENKFGCLKLKDRLSEFLEIDRSRILTANNQSVAIGKMNGQIWMFDSHARNADGKREWAEDAAACLTLFNDIDSLYGLISQNIPTLTGEGDRINWYELHPIQVIIPIRNDVIRTEMRLSLNTDFINKQKGQQQIISTDSRQEDSCKKGEDEHLEADSSEGWIKVKNSRRKKIMKTYEMESMQTMEEISLQENLDNSEENTSNCPDSSDSSTYEGSFETSTVKGKSRRKKSRRKKSMKKKVMANKEGRNSKHSSEASTSESCEYTSEDANNVSTDKELSAESCTETSTGVDEFESSKSEYSTNSEESTNETSRDAPNRERISRETPDHVQHSGSEDCNDASSFDNLLEESRNNTSNNRKRTKDIDMSEVILTNWSTVWDKLTVQLAKHTTPNCCITNIKLQQQKADGCRVCLMYKCENCPWKGSVWTTPKQENDSMDIKEALVLGSINSGTGYTQMKKLFAAAGIKCMNNSRYRSCRDKAYEVLWETLQQNMKEAGKQELEEAIASGNVKNGIGLITVLADGSWMKRSYKTGSFNSPAGLVFIVGQKTGKILWFEIKDMYCSVCDRAKKTGLKGKEHHCYKNWSREQSSSSMESVAIAEGFQKSIELHNLIYFRLIADGDSSVYKRIQEVDPYAEHGTEVQKIECSKHLRRAFKNKVKEIGTNKRGQIGQTRKTFLASGPKCIAEVDSLLKYYWDQERPIDDGLCEELGIAIEAIPRHVFGDHETCARKHPLCNGVPKPNEENVVPNMEDWGFLEEIEDAITRLSIHAESLLLNLDTNVVESANTIVAEKIGGKRINYALRNEYHVRVMAAALQFNTRQVMIPYYKSREKDIPTITEAVEKESQLYHEQRKKKQGKKRNRRNNKRNYGDKDYGPFCEKPDMDENTYTKQLEKRREKEKEMMTTRDKLEEITRRQAKSNEWRRLKKQFVTASNSYKICHKRSDTSCHNIVKSIRNPKAITSSSVIWGTKNESVAKAELEKKLGEKVIECGMFIHREIPGLAATPDGILENSRQIVEIKCPSSAANYRTISEAYIANVPAITNLFTDESCTGIKQNHQYYYQIQMQLEVTDTQLCQFMVWIPQNSVVITIERNTEFWDTKMKSKLIQFYETCLLPELVDSRLSRRMPVKDPQHIMEAKKAIEILKLQKAEKSKIKTQVIRDTKKKNSEKKKTDNTNESSVSVEKKGEKRKTIMYENLHESKRNREGDENDSLNVDTNNSTELFISHEENSNPVIADQSTADESTHASRSGRCRKKPAWFQDYVMEE